MIPSTHESLLTRPLFVHLATLGPDGRPQVNPVWQIWDGEVFRMTTSRTRQKYRNVTADPHVSFSVNDPDQPYRYLEVRGEVETIENDPEGEFFDVLAQRYGLEYTKPIGDSPDRVVLIIRPTKVTFQ